MNAVLLRYLLAFCIIATAHAQWIHYKTPGVPRTKDGKPNLTAPTPLLNGKPEIEQLLPGIGALEVPGDEPTKFPKVFFQRARGLQEGCRSPSQMIR
jgi:hypothetical protein